MAIDFGPDNDVVTKTKSLKLAIMALGILGIFCLLFWAMFADAKTAGCVTKARLGAKDSVTISDIRWSATAGCEYLASIEKSAATWMPGHIVIRGKAEC